MKNTFFYITVLLLSAGAISVHAQSCHEAGPQAQALAPIGVMGSHTHSKGDIMFSYRYMIMGMEGNLTGTSNTPQEEVLGSYMMAPDNMTMQMHMLGAMYTISDRLTAMAMVHYVENDMRMTHKMKMGDMFHYEEMEMASSGFGDVKLMLLFRAVKQKTHCLHFGAGISLPTGGIAERDENGSLLGYAMQTGSGSFNGLIKANYSTIFGKYAVGAQANATLPLNENKMNYRLGNTYNLTFWGSREITHWLSGSLRILGSKSEMINGRNAEMVPMKSPVFDPASSGGERLDALAGLNIVLNKGCCKGLRLAAEAGLPFYQDINGTQMKIQLSMVGGIQYSF